MDCGGCGLEAAGSGGDWVIFSALHWYGDVGLMVGSKQNVSANDRGLLIKERVHTLLVQYHKKLGSMMLVFSIVILKTVHFGFWSYPLRAKAQALYTWDQRRECIHPVGIYMVWLVWTYLINSGWGDCQSWRSDSRHRWWSSVYEALVDSKALPSAMSIHLFIRVADSSITWRQVKQSIQRQRCFWKLRKFVKQSSIPPMIGLGRIPDVDWLENS